VSFTPLAEGIGCPQPPTNITPPSATLSQDGTAIETSDGVWDTHGCETEYGYNWYRGNFLIDDGTDFEYLIEPPNDQGLSLKGEVTWEATAPPPENAAAHVNCSTVMMPFEILGAAKFLIFGDGA
jgi:hypothetical protein